mgnify:CR=1 FL=1
MAKEIQFVLYNLPDNSGTVQAYVENESLWLTQKAMAQLFGVDRTVITKHLKNIFETGELCEDSVCAKFAHTAADGKKYNTSFYSLDAIISVGYRVNSRRATLFRQWATRVLNEFRIASCRQPGGRSRWATGRILLCYAYRRLPSVSGV